MTDPNTSPEPLDAFRERLGDVTPVTLPTEPDSIKGRADDGTPDDPEIAAEG